MIYYFYHKIEFKSNDFLYKMWFLGWLGRLPLGFLYGLSNIFYFFIYYLVCYRKKLVFKHLRDSFPEKTDKERQQIAKDFYRLLADVFVETLKLPYLSTEEIQHRVHIENLALLQGFVEKKQSILSFGAHTGNWEWVPGGLATRGVPIDVVYKTLTNEKSDQFMIGVRSSFGVYPIAMQQLMREIVKRKDQTRVIGLVADQSPHQPDHAHWFEFLNHDTAFFPGTEKIARATQMPVVFGEIYRRKRGYYTAHFHLVATPPYDNLPNGEITRLYKAQLEAAIHRHPSEWLWSHNRWKHTPTKASQNY